MPLSRGTVREPRRSGRGKSVEFVRGPFRPSGRVGGVIARKAKSPKARTSGLFGKYGQRQNTEASFNSVSPPDQELFPGRRAPGARRVRFRLFPPASKRQRQKSPSLRK